MSINLMLPSAEESLKSARSGVNVDSKVTPEVQAATQNRFGSLSPDDQKQVDDFSKMINLHALNLSTDYALDSQRNLSRFTDHALKGVSGKDAGDIGELLSNMSIAIKGFNDDFDDEFGRKRKGLFGRAKRDFAVSKERIKVRYDDVLKTLSGITGELEQRYKEIKADSAMLDELYNNNAGYFKELTMYILAGQKALQEATEGELAELERIAHESGRQEDAQAYSDFQARCSGFEKRLYDIELTREICLQTAPQIRIIQKSNEETLQQITSTINNSMPLWKHGIMTGLALNRSEKANNSVQAVRDLTSEMLIKNAEQLYTNTMAAAKLSEEGYVDPKAIAKCNELTIKTILDSYKIHSEGLKKRNEARRELGKLEGDLKQALLQPYAESPSDWVA